MRIIRNTNTILLSFAILLSCTDDGNIARKRVPVEIVQSTFPEAGTVNQELEIQLRAQATNGCYSDFEIALTDVDSRHFLFKATALFSSGGGYCPDEMVYSDTIITFKPTSTGEYFFQLNEDPFEIGRDTLEVN